MDKLGGDVSDVLSTLERQLAAHGIMSESLGGEVQVVPVSSVTGEGLRYERHAMDWLLASPGYHTCSFSDHRASLVSY